MGTGLKKPGGEGGRFDRHFLTNLFVVLDFGNLPIASLPTNEFLVAQWKEATVWDTFLRTDGCFGEIWWHNLGPDKKVTRWAGGSDPGDFELRGEFNFDANGPPKMLISIRGEPAIQVLLDFRCSLLTPCGTILVARVENIIAPELPTRA